MLVCQLFGHSKLLFVIFCKAHNDFVLEKSSVPILPVVGACGEDLLKTVFHLGVETTFTLLFREEFLLETGRTYVASSAYDWIYNFMLSFQYLVFVFWVLIIEVVWLASASSL